MTGPAFGKIPLESEVYFCFNSSKERIDADVYLHVKGYALARVTHLDVEDSKLEIFVNGNGEFMNCIFYRDTLLVRRRKPKRIDSKLLLALEIKCKTFEKLNGMKSICFVGKKVGGIFIGFQKHIIKILEEIAKEYGIEPK